MVSDSEKTAYNVAAEAKIHEGFKVDADAKYEGWERGLFQQCKFVTATSKPLASVTFEFTCDETHMNRMNNMHGGCIATLFDYTTTMALVTISKPGYWSTCGVSRTLNATYLRPIPLGTTILIENEIVSAGKKLATIKATMKRKSDGVILAICEHGKVNIDAELGIGPKL